MDKIMRQWAKEMEIEFDLHSKNSRDEMRSDLQRESSRRKSEISEVMFESLRRAVRIVDEETP